MPVSLPPILNGAVLTGEDGRIEAVGEDHAVPRPENAARLDLGEAILIPGLVNSHSHLELTALRGLVPPAPFHEWVYRVRRLKEAMDRDAFSASARWGVLESFASGITSTADTGSSLAPAAAMAELGMRGVAFHEVFGPDPSVFEKAMEALSRDWQRLAQWGSQHVRIGVSPHAPYTVSDELVRAVVTFATRYDAPLAMHLAESDAERQLVTEGTGPFAEALRQRGITVAPRGRSCVMWAESVGLLEAAPLLIHCVQCNAADLAIVAEHHATIAHCPWSNRELGHGSANLREMLRAGVTVGIGTDSVATGGVPDLFRDAALAQRAAGLDASEALSLITLQAARATGIADAGTLEPGAWADLLELDARDAALRGPEAAAVTAGPSAVRRTWVSGRLVYDRTTPGEPRWPGHDAAELRCRCEEAGERAQAAVDSRTVKQRTNP